MDEEGGEEMGKMIRIEEFFELIKKKIKDMRDEIEREMKDKDIENEDIEKIKDRIEIMKYEIDIVIIVKSRVGKKKKEEGDWIKKRKRSKRESEEKMNIDEEKNGERMLRREFMRNRKERDEREKKKKGLKVEKVKIVKKKVDIVIESGKINEDGEIMRKKKIKDVEKINKRIERKEKLEKKIENEKLSIRRNVRNLKKGIGEENEIED